MRSLFITRGGFEKRLLALVLAVVTALSLGSFTQTARAQQFEQTWAGQVTETYDGNVDSEYDIEVELLPIPEMTEDLVGEVVGDVSYSLGCSGAWILEEVNEGSVVVEEQIEEGGDCVDNTLITLTPQEDGTLDYYFPDDFNGNIGRATLTLQESSGPDGGPDNDDGQFSGQGEPQCIDGILDRDGDGQISSIEAAQAGADATQGQSPCAGTDGTTDETDDDAGNGGNNGDTGGSGSTTPDNDGSQQPGDDQYKTEPDDQYAEPEDSDDLGNTGSATGGGVGTGEEGAGTGNTGTGAGASGEEGTSTVEGGDLSEGGDPDGGGATEGDDTNEGGIVPILPDTGGASLLALGAGALLVVGGLLARKILR